MSEDQPSLGQLIWLVRRELEWAHAVDADHPLRFDVGTVELDVAVDASRITAGNGGLELKVMGIGASGGVSRESRGGSTTTVHVVLTPRDLKSGDGKFDVSARDTEPPPRWALGPEASAHPGASEGLIGPLSAADTEPRQQS